MNKKILIFFIINITGICIIYSAIEPYLTETKQYTIYDSDIPESFNGKKAVFISDLHCGPFFSTTRVRSVVETINKIGPDIIFLGGDYLTKGLTGQKEIETCMNELKRLDASFGVYGVLGNHEHWISRRLSEQGLNDAGVELLDNKAIWWNIDEDRMRIGGVGDLWESTQEIEPTLNGVKLDDFVILLTHNPDYAEQITSDKIDLVLAGHTHGGQITLFGLWAPFQTTEYGQKYISGMIKTNITQVIVTKGIGTTGLPLRFFAKPEITILEFNNTTN